MRRFKNYRPDWDYVPAANSFSRTIHIVLVATTIGATAGGGVVLSLVDLPTGRASVAAHTVAAPVQAVIDVPEAAQPNPQSIVESTMDSGANGSLGAAASESPTNPNIVAPARIAPLTESGPNDASVKAATSLSAAAPPAENKATKKRRVATRYVQRDGLFGFVLGKRTNRAFDGPYRGGRWSGFYQNGANRYHAWGYGRD
jgi:hypothetical protein